MKDNDYVIDLGLGTATAMSASTGLKNAFSKMHASISAIAGKIKAILSGLRSSVMKAFGATKKWEFVRETLKASGRLDKELLVLRLAFGKLKAAIGEMLAPVGTKLIPMINQTIFALTSLIKRISGVVSVLLGVRQAQRAVTKTVEATAKAIRRTVAGFDQLNRLGSPDGGGYQTVTASGSAISPEAVAMAQKLLALLEPLRNLDFFPLRFSLARLGETVQMLTGQVGNALQGLWFTVLTPFIGWVVEKFAPMFTLLLRDALELISAALTPLGQGFTLLWERMQPVFGFIGTTALQTLDQLRQLFDKLTANLEVRSSRIVGIFQNLGDAVAGLWQVIGPVLVALQQQWSKTFSELSSTAARVLDAILVGLHGITDFLAGVFTEDWDRAWDGLCDSLKACVNLMIGFLNLLLSGVTGAINGVVGVVNKLSFTVPSWVPELGGKTFGFNLQTVTTPQIPYLARGAVLPANRPFLAMVGDQRHGTNVEAPLTTIQEAVAVVLADQLDALMAGFDATVSEIRQLHDTVSGIEVGDSVIGKAAQRYQQKLAVVHGRRY